MNKKIIIKKFELENENEAKMLVLKLNNVNYKSIHMGAGVVSKCRQTKKLDSILGGFNIVEFIPSDYDLNEISKIKK